MKIGKLSMFFILNGIITLGLVVYFSCWLFGEKTRARVIPPFAVSRVTVLYHVEGKPYQNSYLRNDINLNDKYVTVTYLPLHPSSSRIYSFMGIAAQPLAWWLVFLLASAMLLLTDNPVFSKGTRFKLQKQFPWIIMEEYFRLPWFYKENKPASTHPDQTKRLKNLNG